MRYACRTDSNHKQIASCLRRLGFTVKNTSSGADNALDMIVTRDDKSYFVEVKTKQGKLRKSQADFILHNRNAVVIRSEEDCVMMKNEFELLRARSIIEASEAISKVK